MKWDEMSNKFKEHGFKVHADGFDGEFLIASNGDETFEAKEMLNGMEWITSPPKWW